MLEKSYEDFQILKVISIKLGSSQNILPCSVQSHGFNESLEENFLVSGLIIQKQAELERAKKIAESESLKFILLYNCDFNTYEVAWPVESYTIKELEWNNSVIGLYTNLSFIQDAQLQPNQ